MHPPPTVPSDTLPFCVTSIFDNALAGVEPDVEIIVASMT